jgi:hypothetical protein
MARQQKRRAPGARLRIRAKLRNTCALTRRALGAGAYAAHRRNHPQHCAATQRRPKTSNKLALLLSGRARVTLAASASRIMRCCGTCALRCRACAYRALCATPGAFCEGRRERFGLYGHAVSHRISGETALTGRK